MMQPFLPGPVLRLLCGCLIAAAGGAAGRAADAPETAAAKKPRAYTLMTNDKLNIAVVQENDLAVISRVDAKGTVNLNLIGEVHVAGLTIPEAQRAIEQAYVNGRFLRRPQVIINVEDYAPRLVHISGEVKLPASYPLPVETPLTLVDLIYRAGGFTDSAKGSAVTIIRKRPDGTPTVIGPIDVEAMMKGKKSGDASLELQPDDSVNVPQRIF